MSKFGFDKVLTGMERLKKSLPLKVGNDAKNFFTDSFKKEGFEDKQFNRWKPRQARGKVKKKDQTRNILMNTGRLRRSVANSLKSYTFDAIKFSVDVPYAAIHNFGFKGTEYVKPHKRQSTRTGTVRGTYHSLGDERSRSRKFKMLGARANVRGFSRQMNMPQRKFMGSSEMFDKKIEKRIVDEINKIWK